MRKGSMFVLISACAAFAAVGAGTGSFEANGCRAAWSGSELTLGNGRFTRVLRAVGGTIRTVSFRRGSVEWMAEKTRETQAAGPVPEFAAAPASWSCVGEKGIRVTAAFGASTNSWLILPSLPGTVGERPCRLTPEAFDPALAAKDFNAGVTQIREGRAASAGADGIRLAPLHVRVTAYDLRDRTDYTNELISEREWLLMMRELPRLIEANVLTVEDTFTGEGLAFVRLAPLPHIRPVRLPDFVLVGSEYGPDKSAAVTPVDNGWPIAEFAYSGGAVGRTAALHAFQRTLRTYRPDRDGIFLSNTWGGGNSDKRICEEFLLKEVAAGAELGVDVIQIDDGWQKGRSANSSDVARKKGKPRAWGNFREVDPTFWEPCPIRLPHGLEPIVSAAKEKGMRFGLWYGPDSSDDAKHWKDDADCLLAYYRNRGIQYFKIDSLKTPTPAAFANQRRLFDRMLEGSDGAMTFDLDVTCGERPGYFGLPDIGPIFVENRYTSHGGYWPHQTLRSLWSLAHVIDPLRMRFELLDPDRHQEKYSAGDPLRPALYRGDTLFATAMCASPLGWMELSNLSPQRVAEMKPLVARWKAERANLHGGTTWPVGSRPDGHAWTGFVTAARDGGGYLLVFRELNESASFAFDPTPYVGPVTAAETIGGRGTAEVRDGRVAVTVPGKLDFAWFRLH